MSSMKHFHTKCIWRGRGSWKLHLSWKEKVQLLLESLSQFLSDLCCTESWPQFHSLVPLSPTHLWLFIWKRWVNPLPQIVQLKGFSPVWRVRCRLRCVFCPNVLPQTEQLNGFSPVWVLMCWTRLFLRLNLVLHTEQAKGFSPVWTFKCAFRFERCANLVPQTEQLNCFPSVWSLIWIIKDFFLGYFLPQIEQLNILDPVWSPLRSCRRLLWPQFAARWDELLDFFPALCSTSLTVT